jgi:hypothetical protein
VEPRSNKRDSIWWKILWSCFKNEFFRGIKL